MLQHCKHVFAQHIISAPIEAVTCWQSVAEVNSVRCSVTLQRESTWWNPVYSTWHNFRNWWRQATKAMIDKLPGAILQKARNQAVVWPHCTQASQVLLAIPRNKYWWNTYKCSFQLCYQLQNLNIAHCHIQTEGLSKNLICFKHF